MRKVPALLVLPLYPSALRAHGKIWFVTYDGIGLIDPRHLQHNKLPPPVHIEQLTADGKEHEGSSGANGRVPLPPLMRDLTIGYTALSLVVPERVRFRVKLEGQDKDWRELTDRRKPSAM